MAKLGALTAMRNCLEEVLDNSVVEEVMMESEQISESTNKKKTALWVKKAIERLDALADEKTKAQVMQQCGYNCAKKNSKVIQRAVDRRKKCGNIEAFLAAEEKNPPKGTRLVRDGNILIQTYVPQSFTRPMRCYCSLLRQLPSEETVSPTYCICGRGFVEKYWEAIFQKPVKVDLLCSAVSGSNQCKFAIHL